MRFLCDRMLDGLARWLRAAGYDAAMVARDAVGHDIVEQARDEERLLLTRSRDLADRAGAQAVLIADDSLDAQAARLSGLVAIDWELAPFTRCVMDNALLQVASPDDVARMPERTRALAGPFRICPACGRLYWPGSHVKRMAARLARFTEAAAGARDQSGPYGG